MWDVPEEEGRTGEPDDSVTIILGDDVVVRCEDYSVSCAIIQQPATFILRLSAGRMRAGEVIAKYPPGTTFALEIAGKRQFVGRVDGWKANGPAGSTSLELKGRDLLAALHGNDVSAEESFENVTYGDLVGIAMKRCGVDKYPLVLSNDSNRVIKSGVGVTTAPSSGDPAVSKPLSGPGAGKFTTDQLTARIGGLEPPNVLGERPRAKIKTVLGVEGIADRIGGTQGPNILGERARVAFATKQKQQIVSGTGTGVRHVVHAKLGESWLDFVMRHLAKVGLFLFTGHDGSFILATPSKKQQPSSLFVRQRGQRAGLCNVSNAELTNDTTHRYSEVVIYTRGQGRKHGRSKLHGGFVDQEILDYGFKKEKVFRDVNVTNPEQAEFYARRMIAEANRNAWRLSYTFSGHTAPTLVSGQRGIPIPDTIARIKDDELGIHEDLYIESVSFKSPPRETTVTMMRIQDLVFEDDVDRSTKTSAAGEKPTKLELTTEQLAGRIGQVGELSPGGTRPTLTKRFFNRSRKLPSSNPKL